MNKVATIIVSLILALVVVFGGCTQTAPATSSDGIVTIKPTNSESASGIAELEAKIRQLESNNQRLLTENQELRSNLVVVTSMLENVQSEIPDILIMITEIQNDSSDLAAWLKSLPDLPPPPPGLTVSKINDVITKAISLRETLKKLPPPTLLAPSWWRDLDDMKTVFIDMTEWMENLKELPDFLNMAGDLDDLRYKEIAHLENIDATMDNIKSILEEVRNTAASE